MLIKKHVLVGLIVSVAIISSAATVGVVKFIESGGWWRKPIVIMTDKRCEDCNTKPLENSLARLFPKRNVEIWDYSEPRAKELYKSEGLKKLPVVLLPADMKKDPAYVNVRQFAMDGKDYVVLKSGGKFDPTAEICDNGVDDNADGKVDCDDPTCKKDVNCMEKREKPDVDLFVMAYCPYGVQMEKGLLPVLNLLEDKINFKLHFCDYAMHGKKELDEQLRQHCIQKQFAGKFKKYLSCFLEDGDSTRCIKKIGISKTALSACVKRIDEKFNVTKSYNDRSKWKGRFPPFTVDKKEVDEYGVSGSPTLVINDVVVKVKRSPQSLLEAVCKAFSKKPKECDKKLSDATPSPGFGFKGSKAVSSNGSCG